MTRHDFIRRVAAESGETIKKTEKMVNDIFEVIGDILVEGDSVPIRNFGGFFVKELSERNSYNLETKRIEKVPATRRISFKASEILKKAMRGA